MTAILAQTFLVGDQIPWESFGRNLRGPGGSIDTQSLVKGLLALLAVVAVIWVLSWISARYERRRTHARPQQLFLNLCRAHDLRWAECWLLWRLALGRCPSDPARLFLEPQWWAAEQLSLGLRLRAAELEGLRDRLFAGMTSPPENQAPSPAVTEQVNAPAPV